MFFKTGVLKSFAIFTGKHKSWCVTFYKIVNLKACRHPKRLQHRCFPVNIAKCLRIFSHRLTSYASQKHNRNIFNLLKCTSMDIFRLMRSLNSSGKISSWLSGIPEVQKTEPVLPGWTFLHVITGFNLWRV